MPRGERFNVQVAPENGQPYTVVLEIGMEGVDIKNSEGSASLMKIPLETISRWSMRGSRLLLFTKNTRVWYYLCIFRDYRGYYRGAMRCRGRNIL